MPGAKYVLSCFLKKVRQQLKQPRYQDCLIAHGCSIFANYKPTFQFTEMTVRITFDTLDKVWIDPAPPKMEDVQWKNKSQELFKITLRLYTVLEDLKRLFPLWISLLN
jgi:hypothetical protein